MKKNASASFAARKKTGGICAVRSTVTGKSLVTAVPDIRGFQNRFSFSQATGSCVQPKLEKDWNEYGAGSFVLEVLETLEKKPDQTDREFAEDIAALKDLWLEKLDPSTLY